MKSNPYVLITMYFLAFFFPIAVYVYCKRIKRGLLITTASELVILGIIAVVLTYNYTFEILIALVACQLFAFAFVIYDSVKLLRKKEKVSSLE